MPPGDCPTAQTALHTTPIANAHPMHLNFIT